MRRRKSILTDRQRAVLKLRYDRCGTTWQISLWLKISRRAVQYRLKNALRRLGEMHQSGRDRSIPAHWRVFAASQVDDDGLAGVDLDGN